ncbi:extracellular solute-binding protein [Cohnella ginsengisoli]|uniref:Extracellular solute-binding protein n=1 Tax=Cohnella ginsengisoli TaxID=425004 RepID=A0A9X4KLV0_9BACL|nr:extracellular solute-binding protein [Cohnella ginsengisoli]MDG0794443.1 extracellular solute-binding protein [Cohnella ginsengisoli]
MWTKLAEGHLDGWINDEPEVKWKGNIAMAELYKHDPFLTGHSAMTYNSNAYFRNISEAGKELGLAADDWIALSPPASADSRGTDAAFEIPYVFAIPGNAASADAAWELLKYIMSPSQANRLVRFNYGSTLPTVAAEEAKESERSAVFYRTAVDPAYVLEVAERNADPVYKELVNAAWSEAYKRTQNLGDEALDVPALLKAMQAMAEEKLAAARSGSTASTGGTP